MKKIGFTGTQQDLLVEQHRSLILLFGNLQKVHHVNEFHFGCCIGADAEAFEIITNLFPLITTIAHPPEDKSKMSETSLMFADEKRKPLPYLDRNKSIVLETDVLVAAPKGPEKLCSGTWSTIRFARKNGRRALIVWPDGLVEPDQEK